MRIPTLLVALAACSSALASAGPPAPGPDWFASHRAALAAKLPLDAVVVLRAPSESEDLLDAYRPDSNFWYLTGFSEPDAIAVFRPGALEGKRYTLFVKPKSWAEERWTGRRAGVEGAKSEFRADAAYPMADFQKESRALLAGAKALYYADARDKDFREKLVSAWQALAAAGPEPLPALDVAPLLGQMRRVKDSAEIATLREAVRLSVEAHRAALTRAPRRERGRPQGRHGRALPRGRLRAHGLRADRGVGAELGHPPLPRRESHDARRGDDRERHGVRVRPVCRGRDPKLSRERHVLARAACALRDRPRGAEGRDREGGARGEAP